MRAEFYFSPRLNGAHLRSGGARLVNSERRSDMTEEIKSQMISRRGASLLGLAGAFALIAPITLLTCPEAEAQTPGMERRQGRREDRTERRQERRTNRTERRVTRREGRTDRREMRRTGTTGTGTTGQAPPKQ